MADEISGQVTEGGNPVEDAIVIAAAQEEAANLSQAQATELQSLAKLTDANGEYTFQSEELFGSANDYHVVAHKDAGNQRRGQQNYPYVEASAIPDSIEYQFVASSTASGSDWTSEDGTLTLSALGSPTLQSGGLNGEDYLSYDGNVDGHEGTDGELNITQPDALVGVFRTPTLGQAGSRFFGGDDDSTGGNHHINPQANDIYRFFAGTPLESGSSDTNWHIISAYADGANSYIRLDGSELVTGDAGTNDLTKLSVAYKSSSTVEHTELDTPELAVLDSPTAQDVMDYEQYLNDKYAVF